MLSTFAKWLTVTMPEVSVGSQPVTTIQCETWEAAGVQELMECYKLWGCEKRTLFICLAPSNETTTVYSMKWKHKICKASSFYVPEAGEAGTSEGKDAGRKQQHGIFGCGK